MKKAPKLTIKNNFDVKKAIGNLYDATVKVGFPVESSETMSTRDGVSALFKATVNNFGLGVQARPFMVRSFESNKTKYDNAIKKSLGDLENLNYKEFLNKLGVVSSQDVKTAIVELKEPANSPATIAAKGSSNPLVDTGHMLQSVTYQIVK